MRVTRWQAVRRLHRMQKWRTTSETGRGKVVLLQFLLFTELYLRSGLDLVVVAGARRPATAGRMPALRHAKELEEFCGLVVVTGENLGEILVAQVPRYGFADYLAEVGGQGEVAAFIELRLIEAGPAAVDFASLDRAAQDEPHVSVAVVGAAIAVFAHVPS